MGPSSMGMVMSKASIVLGMYHIGRLTTLNVFDFYIDIIFLMDIQFGLG